MPSWRRVTWPQHRMFLYVDKDRLSGKKTPLAWLWFSSTTTELRLSFCFFLKDRGDWGRENPVGCQEEVLDSQGCSAVEQIADGDLGFSLTGDLWAESQQVPAGGALGGFCTGGWIRWLCGHFLTMWFYEIFCCCDGSTLFFCCLLLCCFCLFLKLWLF